MIFFFIYLKLDYCRYFNLTLIMIHDKEVVINPRKTYTKSAYARAYNISLPTIDKKILNKELSAINVNGTKLILAA